MTINEFLKKFAQDIKDNEREYRADDFYYILKYLGVKKNNTLAEEIEKFYEDFLNNLGNSLVKYETKKVGEKENTTNYIGFYVDKKANYENAVKVYFSVKYEYVISALKTLFLYLIRNSIKAQVKFQVKATNENIVIRFYDAKDVEPFITYANSNFILEDLLEKVNPFIASIYGIGVVRDDNTVNTYNGTLSLMLEEYFSLLKNEDNLNKASDLDFIDYLIKRANIEENEAMKFNIKAIEENIRAILNHAEKDLI